MNRLGIMVWQVGLLTLFAYHRDSEVLLASLMNLACAIVVLIFYLKKYVYQKVCLYYAYTVKKLSVFPFPAGMSLTKLSLHGQK
jgi:hypothetical protein